MKPMKLAAAAATVSVLLTACGSSGTSSSAPSTPASTPVTTAASSTHVPSPTPASAGGITINSFKFAGELTVAAGSHVTVTNNDTVAHTLTDKTHHLFDTGNIAGGGGTATFTAPSKPGTYKFGCTYHPDMAGVLTVTG